MGRPHGLAGCLAPLSMINKEFYHLLTPRMLRVGPTKWQFVKIPSLIELPPGHCRIRLDSPITSRSPKCGVCSENTTGSVPIRYPLTSVTPNLTWGMITTSRRFDNYLEKLWSSTRN
ncbi:hypothetical protein Fcan01_02059 [Folsomia candida]|uniref:Uncharacterized protein n=1 Tax=Folsomia candida TaxID=158441 RepID=A0A226F0U8_FOLCA|nr:hypothetical protein Fcan01_02059 [Folsomia candida]